MTRSKPITFFASAAVVPLAAVAVAACGGGGGAASAATATSSSTPKTTHTQTAKVRVADSRLGKILVDSQGRTLYLFKADSGARSACSGACATAWPPLRSGGKPAVGSGARASLVGTSPRSDGAAQVTYNGHPLYLFVKDHKPGDINGQGVTAFGAAWFVVSPAGTQISNPGSGGGGGSSSRPAATTAPPAAKPQPAPKPTPQPATPPPAKPAPKPAAKPAPPATTAARATATGTSER